MENFLTIFGYILMLFGFVTFILVGIQAVIEGEESKHYTPAWYFLAVSIIGIVIIIMWFPDNWA